MNKDRFHNQIALSLGYVRIVNDKRINIRIDDKSNPDDPLIKIDALTGKLEISYNASQNQKEVLSQMQPGQIMKMIYEDFENEILEIIDVTHRSYIQATTNKYI